MFLIIIESLCALFFLFHTVHGRRRRKLAVVTKELIDLLKEENKSAAVGIKSHAHLDEADKDDLKSLLKLLLNPEDTV